MICNKFVTCDPCLLGISIGGVEICEMHECELILTCKAGLFRGWTSTWVKLQTSEASQKMQPTVWESGWEAKEGGGERKKKTRLPTLMVYLGNLVHRRMEFLIGEDSRSHINWCLSAFGVFFLQSADSRKAKFAHQFTLQQVWQCPDNSLHTNQCLAHFFNIVIRVWI